MLEYALKIRQFRSLDNFLIIFHLKSCRIYNLRLLICNRIVEQKDQRALGKLVLGKMALGKMVLGKMASGKMARWVKWHWVKWHVW